MDDRYRIRAATTPDADRIAALEQACFRDPWSRAGIAQVLDAPFCVSCVAELGGSVIGYAMARWVAGSGEILNLAVDPGHRRAGIARALLDRTLAMLLEREVSEVFLEVRASNSPAQALYHLRGFRVAGMRRAYYRHPVEDALVLRLSLTGAA